MIGNILNFNIESYSRKENYTTVVFIFDKPSGDLGAYELYKSDNNNVFSVISTKVDTLYSDLTGNTEEVLVTVLNNKIYFSYDIPSTDDGKTLYFKIKAVSPYQERSSFSETLIFNNYCSTVSNLKISYDNYNIGLLWDNINTSDNKNINFKDYVVFRQGVKSITNIDFDPTEGSFYSPELTIDSFVWVIDRFTHSYWCGKVTTEGYFLLDRNNATIIENKNYTGVVVSVIDSNNIQISPPLNNKFLYNECTCTINSNSKQITSTADIASTQLELSITDNILPGDSITITEKVIKINDALNISNSINEHNIKVYIEDNELVQIGSTKNNNFLDDTFDKEKNYLYKVYTRNISGLLTDSTPAPVYTTNLLKTIPYLRHPSNSDDIIIKQVYWKSMKNSLVDKNYYFKERLDLPYLHNIPLHLKGFLGVSDCNVDIFLNDHYHSTIVSDSYGEFDFYFVYPKGKSKIKFQARDKQNIDFSNYSSNYIINTINSYTMFGIVGEVLDEYIEELNAIRLDNNINTARYSTFITKYAPYIELYKSGEENDTDFMELASTIFSAYEYAGYDKSLNMVLDKFLEKVPEFDHYEIYTRNSIYDTVTTGRFFVPTTPSLTRQNYYYGVSAAKSTGEETPLSIIRVDSRWWPFKYKGYNAFMWDEVPEAEFYKVYRGTSIDNLCYLATAFNNVFIDNGSLTENTSILPYKYNYSGMNIPLNFKVYLRTKLSQMSMLYKKLGNTVIMLFTKDNSTFPELHFTRLKTIFRDYIPPEIRYTVFIVKDNSIYMYPNDITIIDETNVVYGRYDISFYDTDVVYG